MDKDQSLEEKLRLLAELDSIHLSLATQLFEADGGNVYPLDFLAVGVLNRSLAHSVAIRSLIESNNVICAGSLLRLQIDNAARFYAAWIVSDPHEFALKVWKGESVNRQNDRKNVQMSDSYLIKGLGGLYEWLPDLYTKTCGYIHLSQVHMSIAAHHDELCETERVVRLGIGLDSSDIPESVYHEFVDAFASVTDIIFYYINSWVYTKQNPHLCKHAGLTSGKI